MAGKCSSAPCAALPLIFLAVMTTLWVVGVRANHGGTTLNVKFNKISCTRVDNLPEPFASEAYGRLLHPQQRTADRAPWFHGVCLKVVASETDVGQV